MNTNTNVTLPTGAEEKTVAGWLQALNLHDPHTGGDPHRVSEATVRLAQAMGIEQTNLSHVRHGALLHDIGKLAIPTTILHKPGPLSHDEWRIMQQHTVYAETIMQPLETLRSALAIPYYHHERWDGSGYPHGMQGEDIPLEARIFSVVDVWDALLSERPYRPAWEQTRIAAYICSQAGSQFDPRVVKAFIALGYLSCQQVVPQSGSLHTMSLAQVLHTIEKTGSSGVLELIDGSRHGIIALHQGQPLEARIFLPDRRALLMSFDEAMQQMRLWQNATFIFDADLSAYGYAVASEVPPVNVPLDSETGVHLVTGTIPRRALHEMQPHHWQITSQLNHEQTVETLAQNTGLSLSQTTQAVRDLVELGVASIEQSPDT